jgi:hypothetical protein
MKGRVAFLVSDDWASLFPALSKSLVFERRNCMDGTCKSEAKAEFLMALDQPSNRLLEAYIAVVHRTRIDVL